MSSTVLFQMPSLMLAIPCWLMPSEVLFPMLFSMLAIKLSPMPSSVVSNAWNSYIHRYFFSRKANSYIRILGTKEKSTHVCQSNGGLGSAEFDFFSRDKLKKINLINPNNMSLILPSTWSTVKSVVVQILKIIGCFLLTMYISFCKGIFLL